jgi:hypothetical protein
MDTFKYRITLDVEVEAFDEGDAMDAVQDQFGLGNQNGVEVTSFEVKLRRGNRK